MRVRIPGDSMPESRRRRVKWATVIVTRAITGKEKRKRKEKREKKRWGHQRMSDVLLGRTGK